MSRKGRKERKIIIKRSRKGKKGRKRRIKGAGKGGKEEKQELKGAGKEEDPEVYGGVMLNSHCAHPCGCSVAGWHWKAPMEHHPSSLECPEANTASAPSAIPQKHPSPSSPLLRAL